MNIYFPHILFDEPQPKLQKGSIFDCPNFCMGKKETSKCVTYYSRIKTIQGFSICPYGFSSYTTKVAGKNIILSGMKISDNYDRKKLKHRIISEFVPAISVNKFYELIEKNNASIRTELALQKKGQDLKDINEHIFPNIHEIRKLNREIKGQAEHAALLYEKIENADSLLKFRIDNIYHTSSLISIRLDFYDWQMNPSLINSMPKNPVEIYKKFDKVKHCLSNYCNTIGITIKFEGVSYTTIQGIQILDLLPFLLLENATKYSQHDQVISVNFSSNGNYEFLEITNIGPLVKSSEIGTIFGKKIRGKWAEKKEPGSGIGLYFAKQICDIHDIEITAISKNLEYAVNNIPQGVFKIRLKYLKGA